MPYSLYALGLSAISRSCTKDVDPTTLACPRRNTYRLYYEGGSECFELTIDYIFSLFSVGNPEPDIQAV